MIKVTNLTKKFGDFKAVDDINFEIEKGTIVGFLGPNGAGKTTTMRMLSGFTNPNTGEIEIGGKNFNESELELKSKIGYMPENNPIYKDMLVKELLDLTLKLNNVPKGDYKDSIDYALKAVHIKDKYYRPISELSKGYKQRVGLAQALINKPEILILDEPTEGLDPNQRAEIRNLVKEVGKERTVILSTHVMQEVEAMCNRIIILNEGKIIADGNKKEVLAMKDGNSRIKIEVKGEGVKDKMNALDNVKVAKFKQKKKTSQMIVEIVETEDFDKVYEKISKEIFKNKWIIHRFEPVQNTLEEIFYQLTK